jgi:hypothetical protein
MRRLLGQSAYGLDPVGLFRPAPGFLAALEPRQVNQGARELTRI